METNTILKKIYKRTLLQYIAYTVGLLVVFVLAVYLAAFFDFHWVYDFDSNIYTFLAFFYNIVKNPLSLLLLLLICIVISFAFICLLVCYCVDFLYSVHDVLVVIGCLVLLSYFVFFACLCWFLFFFFFKQKTAYEITV